MCIEVRVLSLYVWLLGNHIFKFLVALKLSRKGFDFRQEILQGLRSLEAQGIESVVTDE